MKTPRLNENQIEAELAACDEGWVASKGVITREITAPTFPQGIELVKAVADAAEQMNHHPDIDIRYRRVRFALTTHDSGGLTKLDFELARAIDAAARQFSR